MLSDILFVFSSLQAHLGNNGVPSIGRQQQPEDPNHTTQTVFRGIEIGVHPTETEIEKLKENEKSENGERSVNA